MKAKTVQLTGAEQLGQLQHRYGRELFSASKRAPKREPRTKAMDEADVKHAAGFLGTPYAGGGPLATSLREWVNAVWPSARLRRRTAIELALSRLREGHQLVATPAGESVLGGTITPSGPGIACCYHGCNPRMLAGILRDGLLPSYGKQNILGVWSSPHIYTAVGYPQEMLGSVAVTDVHGPAVRVVLT